MANYKSCPLKKRPIVFVNDAVEEATITQTEAMALTYKSDQHYNKVYTADLCSTKEDEQPQDLSLKRKASHDIEEYVTPAKREYVLNLQKSASMPAMTQESSPIFYKADHYSALLTPPAELDSSMEYRPSEIHMRGLTAATTCYTTNPYQSAFVVAAGCNPMSALWHNYQQPQDFDSNSIYPSPASSFVSAAASPHSVYSYQHMTPPLSPGSDVSSEPEDLSIANDIPLPALFHLFDEAPSTANSTSSHNKKSQQSSCADAATNLTCKNYRFKCDKCNKMYSTSMGLSKHQQFHCPAAVCNQEKKSHSCEECGKLYTTIGALKMHIRTHTLPCKCPICGKAFSRHWLLQGHIRTHTGEKPYKCPDCPRSFADRSNLRAHQQTHVDVKKYACKVCNKSFSRMSLLNKHASSNCAIIVA